MFYKLIQKKRDLWLTADNCPIRELLSYIISKAKLRDLKEVLDDVVAEDYAEFSCQQMQDGLFAGYRIEINKFACDRVYDKIHAYNEKGIANTNEKKKFTPITISDTGLELIEFLSVDCTSADDIWHSDSEIKIDKFGYVIRNGVKSKDCWDGTITCNSRCA